MGGVSLPASNDIVAPGLAVVIPAFNESRSIQAVIQQVSQRALAIVVDDGSIDDTAALARAAGAHVVSHPYNRGYDDALETGIRTALALGCTFAVTMDADGQHDPTLIDRFLAELEAGADLVIGRRDRTQRWSEALFCIVGRVVWGLYDPLCGMKGYRLAILAKIADLNTYASIGTELAVRLIKSGIRASQPKIQTRPREGISRFGGGFNANLRICKALWIGLGSGPVNWREAARPV
jgi:glycosyltransferase involved in cell wall biosynthesis